MSLVIWVALGGAVGASLRHLLAIAAASLLGPAFPFGTLACNVLGSAAIGWLAVTLEHDIGRAFWMIGVLGGFTTFSAFSLQTLELAQQGHMGLALLYITLSLTLCLVGVALGMALGRNLG